MKFLEKDLEDIIWESDKEELAERGFIIYGKLFRQLKIGNYGIADLVSINRGVEGLKNALNINVIELKKDSIGISAFLQAVNYVKGIDSYLKFRKFSHPYFFNITLIGSEIDTSGSFCFIQDLFSSYLNEGGINEINFLTYDYKVSGIYFNDETGYDLTNKGFEIGGKNE